MYLKRIFNLTIMVFISFTCTTNIFASSSKELCIFSNIYSLNGYIKDKSLTNTQFYDESAQALVETDNGEFLVTGRISNNKNQSNGDVLVVKTDNSGKIKWFNIYEGENDEWARCLVKTSDGGFLIAGFTYSSDNFYYGFEEMFLIKINIDGLIEWSHTYNGPVHVAGLALIQTNDGGFAIAGCKFNDSYNSMMWLVKTDLLGILQWEHTYGTNFSFNIANALIQTSDGGFVVAGSTHDNVTEDTNILVIKTDEIGIMQWNQTYNRTVDQLGIALIQTQDKGLVLADTIFYGGADKHDMWLLKTNSTGDMIWSHTYGGDGDKWLNALIQTTDNGFALAGSTDRWSQGHGDIWFIKTDHMGTLEWFQMYGGNSHEMANDMIQSSDGGFILVGSKDSTDSGNYDMLMIKIDSSGSFQWGQSYSKLDYTSEKSFTLSNLFNEINPIGLIILVGIITIISLIYHKR